MRGPELRLGTPADVGMETSRLQQIKGRAHRWVAEGATRGLVLLAARHGRVVLHEAFGFLTPNADSPPMPLDALFRTESAGKVLTATALMILVEEGKVGLNRPVIDYVPEFAGPGKEMIRVHDLLTHTSGLFQDDINVWRKQHQGKVPLPPPEPTQPQFLREYFAAWLGCPPRMPPGKEMSYCSYGFDLLGEIVRRVSGCPLDQFAHDRLFAPLGMTDTYFCREDGEPARRVVRPNEPAYAEDNPDSWDVRASEQDRVVFGSGSALTTAMDLARFGQMFLNGGCYGDSRIISSASVAAMTRNQTLGIPAKFLDAQFPESSWGLGWSIHSRKTGYCGALYSDSAYEHWGAGGIYFMVDPERDLVAIYLSSVPYARPDAAAWDRNWRLDYFSDMVVASVTGP
jgi:CubicO group peptidase (beta-lactamase class C family)